MKILRPRPQSSGSYRDYRIHTAGPDGDDDDDERERREKEEGMRGYRLPDSSKPPVPSRGDKRRLRNTDSGKGEKPFVIWIIGEYSRVPTVFFSKYSSFLHTA